MPYITKNKRDEVDAAIETLSDLLNARGDIGVMNYAITKLLLNYTVPELARYQDYNTAIGVLECAKLELYRRYVAEYEEKARKANGEVYDGQQWAVDIDEQ